MSNRMRSWLVAACAVAVLTACQKVTHTLEGKWQLSAVEADGRVSEVDTVWYNFQTSLFEYQVYIPATGEYLRKFGYKTLSDDETRLDLELIEDYNKPPLKEFLRRTDWSAAKRSFTIEESSVTRLVLSGDGKRYTFKRF